MQAQQRGWVPPEAAAAAADAAEQHGSWTCSACTLINAPQVNRSATTALLRWRHRDAIPCRQGSGARTVVSLHPALRCVQAQACEACGSGRQEPAATRPAENGGSPEPAGRAADAKPKPKKVSKFERTRGLSLSSGDPDATRRWLQSNGAAPEMRGSSSGSREPGQPRGMWARQGQLAQQMRVVQDAYGNV